MNGVSPVYIYSPHTYFKNNTTSVIQFRIKLCFIWLRNVRLLNDLMHWLIDCDDYTVNQARAMLSVVNITACTSVHTCYLLKVNAQYCLTLTCNIVRCSARPIPRQVCLLNLQAQDDKRLLMELQYDIKDYANFGYNYVKFSINGVILQCVIMQRVSE